MYIILEKLIGILFIGLGFYTNYYSYKNPNKIFKALNFRAYIAGVGFIIIGILIIVGEFHILDVLIRKFSDGHN